MPVQGVLLANIQIEDGLWTMEKPQLFVLVVAAVERIHQLSGHGLMIVVMDEAHILSTPVIKPHENSGHGAWQEA